VHVWQPRTAVRCWPAAVQKAASASFRFSFSILLVNTLGRLRKRREFLAVQKSGNKCVTSGLVMQAAESDYPSETRIGFTVTKKLGNAVKRNRIKRRLRAVVKDVLPGQVKPGYDLVFIGRATSADRPYADLKTDVMTCIEKLGLRD